ncbi:YihY/virulence factor BrkB family protein [Rurimicrobium arvi]|uniref:YihY/virulence factor BrkB family protein n=1 Tax=Rurimicrobium arvi TaxID=2049916 RepID=A0ABP8MRG8_9BACT
MQVSIKSAARQFLLAFRLLSSKDPLRLAGATAFFATFALPFILIILVQVLSLVINRKTISHEFFTRMSAILGQKGMSQLVTTVRGFRGLVNTPLEMILGSLFMIFVATTLFRVIKNSMNELWLIRLKPGQRFTSSLTSRFHSLILILLTGVLFVAGGLLESLQLLFGRNIDELIPGTGIVFTGFVSFLISVSVTTIWFGVLLFYVPDGRPERKPGITGAILTALLFALGKWILKVLLVNSNIDRVFGAAGSFVLVLLFVFYSSMILYFGAAFTKVWSDFTGRPIRPANKAVSYTIQDHHDEES